MNTKLAIGIAALPPLTLLLLLASTPGGQVIGPRWIIGLFGVMIFPVGFGPAIFFLRGGWKLKMVAGFVWLANLLSLIFLGLGIVMVAG